MQLDTEICHFLICIYYLFYGVPLYWGHTWYLMKREKKDSPAPKKCPVWCLLLTFQSSNKMCKEGDLFEADVQWWESLQGAKSSAGSWVLEAEAARQIAGGIQAGAQPVLNSLVAPCDHSSSICFKGNQGPDLLEDILESHRQKRHFLLFWPLKCLRASALCRHSAMSEKRTLQKNKVFSCVLTWAGKWSADSNSSQTKHQNLLFLLLF